MTSVAKHLKLYVSFTEDELSLIENDMVLENDLADEDIEHWTINLISSRLCELREYVRYEKA